MPDPRLTLPPAAQTPLSPARLDSLILPSNPQPSIVACDQCGCLVHAQFTHVHDRVCPGRT